MQSSNLNNHYGFSYADYAFSHHHAYLWLPLLKLISEHKTNSSTKLRVLDLGCGNGSLSQEIAQQGYEVVGVDESVSEILFAHQNFPKCSFIQGSIYNLPYADLGGRFDIVIAAEVIEHLLYPRELVRTAIKCLKPGGRLIITTPYHGYWKNLTMSLFGKIDQHFTVLWDGGHIKFFSVHTLTKLLIEEGCLQIKFEFAGRFPYLWKSMLCSSLVTSKSD